MTARAVARGAAVAIAVAAAIDPSWQAERPVRPRVGIVVADSPTMSLPASGPGDVTRRGEADRVRRVFATALAAVADIEADAADGQRALVVIGDRLPAGHAVPPGAIVTTVSVGEPSAPLAAIESIAVAPRLPAGGQARVSVMLQGNGLDGQTTTVALTAGSLVVGTQSHTWRAGTTRAEVGFDLVPWAAGPLALRAVAATTGADGIAETSADAATHVDSERVRVLVLDAHPTWTSRFVALALSRDPEIELVSRTLVGPGVAVRTDTYEDSVLSPDGTGAFDVVLVSSPDAESRLVLDWLDAFMRVRGGSLVVIADDVAGLAATRRWWTLTVRERTTGTPSQVAFSQDGNEWRAGVFADPVEMPVLARTLAATREARPRPAVVTLPVGHGRLVANLALDAWRYRGDEGEPFARAFRSLIVTLGRESRRALDIAPLSVEGPERTVAVRARVLRQAGGAAAVHLPVAGTAPSEPVSEAVLWPNAADGVFRGRLPLATGDDVVTIEARHAGATARAALSRDGVEHATPRLPLSWLAGAHGGLAGTSDEAGTIADALGQRLAAAERSETVTTRPMHSPWWLAPFVAALGVEWVSRRRAGLR